MLGGAARGARCLRDPGAMRSARGVTGELNASVGLSEPKERSQAGGACWRSAVAGPGAERRASLGEGQGCPEPRPPYVPRTGRAQAQPGRDDRLASGGDGELGVLGAGRDRMPRGTPGHGCRPGTATGEGRHGRVCAVCSPAQARPEPVSGWWLPKEPSLTGGPHSGVLFARLRGPPVGPASLKLQRTAAGSRGGLAREGRPGTVGGPAASRGSGGGWPPGVDALPGATRSARTATFTNE